MVNPLIIDIGKQLGITRATESENEWVFRIAYSAAGRTALSSLWDHPENENTVSVQHLKKKTEHFLTALAAIHTELNQQFPGDRQNLINDIYSIYRRTGYLYHAQYQITPAAPSKAGTDQTTLFRGISPGTRLHMSGLGFYIPIGASSYDQTVSQMFGLQEQPMPAYLEELASNGDWQTVEWPGGTKFLRMKPPFSLGYWQEKPDTDGKISLAAYGDTGRKYVLYRYENGTPFGNLQMS